MHHLPTEIILAIASNLTKNERLKLRAVNNQLSGLFSVEVYQHLVLGQPLDRQSRTVVTDISAFNYCLHRNPERALLVKTLAIYGSIHDKLIEYESLVNLESILVACDSVSDGNWQRVVTGTSQAKTREFRLHLPDCTILQGIFARHPPTSLTLVTQEPLPLVFESIFGQPVLPEPVDQLAVYGSAEYTEILQKSIIGGAVNELELYLPIMDPFRSSLCLPRSVGKLSIGMGMALSEFKVRSEFIRSLTVINPASLLRNLIAPQVESLTLKMSSKVHEQDDPDGQCYSIEEKSIRESAHLFPNVTELCVFGISLSLTGWLCSNLGIKSLTIREPKSASTTTFNDFNGMMTRLTHHSLELFTEHCYNLERLQFDQFFGFCNHGDGGADFLKSVLKHGRLWQLDLSIEDDVPTTAQLPYATCCRQSHVQFEEMQIVDGNYTMERRLAHRTVYNVDLAALHQFFLLG